MNARWSTCAASTNGCPPNANPISAAVDLYSSCPGIASRKTRVDALMTRASIKNTSPKRMDCNGTRACPSSATRSAASRASPTRGAKPGNDSRWIGVLDQSYTTPHDGDVASLPARHVQARIVELQGGVADRCMDLAAVDTGSVDAGLRKFIPSVLVALVDEYVVVDAAGDDVKLGMRDMSCGELGVVLGRRLGIARADRDVGRHGELPQPGLIHAEGLHDPGRHREHGLHPLVVHVERRGGVERQFVAQIFRHHLIVAPAALEGEVLVVIDPRAADPERGEAALRMAGGADPIRVDGLAPERVVQQQADAEADVARALPELVREVGDRRVVRVGAVMVERGYDVTTPSQKLGEPGVKEAVAAAPVGEHDERMLRGARRRLGVLVKVELGEERHGKRRGGPLA